MKGLWKIKLSGFNRKGFKRKSCTKRQAFNDNAKVIYRRFGSYIETEDKFYENATYEKVEIRNKEYFRISKIYGLSIDKQHFWNIICPLSQGVRKSSQNKANRLDRAKLRNWLSKKDYDMEKEIKTHSLSKSIAWDIN